MSHGIYSALSGAIAQARALEVVSNNLSNVDTTGYKAQRLTFQEVMTGLEPGEDFDPTMRQVKGVDTTDDLRQGVIRDTGNPLDVALEGPGFFVVKTQAGNRFTRSGAFVLSPEGNLLDAAGNSVMGQAGTIQVQDTNRGVHIDLQGTVYNGERAVDKLRIVEVPQDALIREGHGLWNIRDGIMPKASDTKVQNGSLERSNVNAVKAMTELLWVARAYETFNRTIEMFRETDGKTVNNLTP